MTDDADSLNASIAPCLSPLNASIRGPKAIENQRKKQKRGFPIKDFGNDKKGRSSLLNASIIPKSLIPECLYQESKLFKDKNIWMPA